MTTNNDWLKSHGAIDILNLKDISDLKSGILRVLKLLLDFNWHDANEIRLVAGNGTTPASEGLRRLRDLRSMGYVIQRQKIPDTRLFCYRLVSAPIQENKNDQQQQKDNQKRAIELSQSRLFE